MVKISIVHIYLYGMIKRKVGGGNIIQIGEIHPVIKWCVRLPRKYQAEIIKELVEAGLLKKIGRDNYEILPCLHRKPPIDSLGEPLW
jgi:hypothetical protein